MATLMQDTAHEQRATSTRVEAAGRELARYGLVVVVAWIGLMKFTAYEAEGIRPFVANSPLLSWVYGPLSVQGFSAVLGRRRGRHRAAHCRAAALASGFRPRQRLGGRDVPHDLELPRHDAGRLGAECRRLPRPLGVPGADPHQGSGPTRDFALDARRGLESG
jgi:Protein of unknown function, DUF417